MESTLIYRVWCILQMMAIVLSNKLPCRDPPYLQHKAKEALQSKILDNPDPSFYKIPDFAKRYLSHPEIRTNKELKVKIYGERNCPQSIKSEPKKETMERSVCPSYLEMTYDKRRIPRYIVKARCRCKHCVMKSDVEPTYESRVKQYYCKPVVVYKWVFRAERNCRPNSTILNYDTVLEPVPVSCYCVVPKIKLRQ